MQKKTRMKFIESQFKQLEKKNFFKITYMRLK